MLEDGVGWLDEKFKENEEMVGGVGWHWKLLKGVGGEGFGEKRDCRERSMQVGGEGFEKKAF